MSICVSLLAAHRPVCLIDEPESCLHPPQEKALGQFIGKHGSSPTRTTLVATHSSHILKGVAESASHLQIIRLSKSNRKFSAHRIDYEVLMKSIDKPAVRTETVLDGIFADAVVVVEADGDRAVYEAAFQLAKQDGRFDIVFVPVSGHGSIPDVVNFYKRLEIPVAVITDLDLVLEENQLKNILRALGALETFADEIRQFATTATELILKLPPPIEKQEIRDALNELNSEEHWEKLDHAGLMCRLRALSNKLDKKKVVKAGGISAFSENEEIQTLLQKIVNHCSAFNYFLVPNGEVEHWMPELMADVSKQNKAEWSNQAVERMNANAEKAEDIKEFVMRIFRVLQQQRDKQVGIAQGEDLEQGEAIP